MSKPKSIALAVETERPAPKKLVIEKMQVIGDSMVSGVNSVNMTYAPTRDNFAQYLASKFKSAITNFSALGASSQEVCEQARHLTPCDLILISVGSNDVFSRVNPMQFQSNVDAILAMAKKSAKTVVLMGLPDFARLAEAHFFPKSGGIDWSGVFVRDPENPPLFKQFNRILQESAARNGVVFADLSTIRFDSSDFGQDGFHPGPRGHRKIMKLVQNVLASGPKPDTLSLSATAGLSNPRPTNPVLSGFTPRLAEGFIPGRVQFSQAQKPINQGSLKSGNFVILMRVADIGEFIPNLDQKRIFAFNKDKTNEEYVLGLAKGFDKLRVSPVYPEFHFGFCDITARYGVRVDGQPVGAYTSASVIVPGSHLYIRLGDELHKRKPFFKPEYNGKLVSADPKSGTITLDLEAGNELRFNVSELSYVGLLPPPPKWFRTGGKDFEQR